MRHFEYKKKQVNTLKVDNTKFKLGARFKYKITEKFFRQVWTIYNNDDWKTFFLLKKKKGKKLIDYKICDWFLMKVERSHEWKH